MYKYYANKSVKDTPDEKRAWGIPGPKHATISVITHTANGLAAVDEYLDGCARQFTVEHIKRMDSSTAQAWADAKQRLNAQFNKRGKNVVLECLQFGGNSEFRDGFEDERSIQEYFHKCYRYAVDKIGYLHTDKNVICAVIITEPNRRNLFVYYLPVTEKWCSKVMSTERSENGNKLQKYDEYGLPLYRRRFNVNRPRLCHSEFWKQRGGLTSYSDLQEDFYNKVSEQYGAVRGESFSLIKNTNAAQARRFHREEGDEYDELLPFDDMPYG